MNILFIVIFIIVVIFRVALFRLLFRRPKIGSMVRYKPTHKNKALKGRTYIVTEINGFLLDSKTKWDWYISIKDLGDGTQQTCYQNDVNYIL